MHNVSFCFFVDGEYIETDGLQERVPRVGELITFRGELQTRVVTSVREAKDAQSAAVRHVVRLDFL